MWARVAYILDGFGIENLCLFYFFAAPMLQDNANIRVLAVVLGISYLISGSIALLVVTEWLSRFSDRVRATGLGLIVLGMVGVCFMSLAVNSPEYLAKPSAYYFKYLRLILPVFCFFVMSALWTIRDVSRLYAILLASGACALLFLVPEILFIAPGGSLVPRLASYFIDSNKYALFLNIVCGFTLPYVIQERLKGRSMAAGVGILTLIFLQLFLSQSRGGIIANALIIFVCFLPRRARKVVRSATPLFLAASLLFVASLGARYFGSQDAAEITAESGKARLVTYSVAAKIIADRPLQGIGFANIMRAYDRYGVVEKVILSGPMAVHNAMLEIFAEEGFLGLIFFLLLVFVPIFMLVRKIRKAGREGRYPVPELAALGIPLAFLGFGVVSPNYLAEDYFWVYMSFTVMIIRSKIPPDFELKLPRPRLV